MILLTLILTLGFGSMVIEDSTKLVTIIKQAASITKCRILLQSGWTKYADDYAMITPEVMVIGAMPHDYLFSVVSGVIHHGGAGTTSAGLRAGNPTFIWYVLLCCVWHLQYCSFIHIPIFIHTHIYLY